MAAEESFEGCARATHLSYWHNFEGMQFRLFSQDERKEQCLMICYVINGPPNEVNEEDLYYSYDENQRKQAEMIEKILQELRRKKNLMQLRVFSTLVYCKMGEKQFSVPVFRIAMDNSSVPYRSMYVDCNGSTYKDWNDWLKNNRLPKMEYCYPKFGYYTCDAEGKYGYREDQEPILCFGESPACSTRAKIRTGLDIAGTVVGVAAGVMGIAAIALTPLGVPAIAAVVAANGAVGAGIGSGIVAAGRSVDRLIDKGTHGESLKDLESAVSIITVAAMPLSFATSISTAICANAVRNGRALSNALRVATKVLNVMNVGVQGGFMATGIVNLVKKKRRNKLKPLDVLQFTMSVFFFTNSLMSLKTAYAIISEAQAQMAVPEHSNPITGESLCISPTKPTGTGNEPKGVVRPLTIIKDRNFSLVQVTKNEHNVYNSYTNGASAKTLIGTVAGGVVVGAAANRVSDTFKSKQT